MISLRDIVAGWNRFFFEPISPVPIAVFRIALGLVMITNYLLMFPDVDWWFYDRGTLPVETAKNVSGGIGVSLFRIWPAGNGWVWGFMGLSLGAAILFTLGLWTRVSSVLVFVTLVSLHHRNPVILNSGDSILRIATFFMMFAPSGAALSVDRWLRVRRGVESGPPKFQEPWAQRLIQCQIAFLYLHAFVWKAMGPMWLDGTAVYYTSRLVEFFRFPVPYVFEHLWTIKLWTWGTLVIEFALGVLIWIKELRYWVLLAGVMLHLGIDYSMNIPMFGPAMVATYITWVEADKMERAFAWMKGRLKPGSAAVPARPVAPVKK